MTTMLMVDHGADVVKIEPPAGDPFNGQLGYKVWGRGKRSAVLDLKSDADKASFMALARHADVVVESFAPGVTKRLGIDYATLSELNPRLVYCSISAYGDTSHADRPGYDALVSARTGLQWEQRGWPEGALYHMSGLPDPFADVEIPFDWVQGAPRPGPLFSASHWPSLGAFFLASTGVNAALVARETTGRGQLVETSLMQGAFAGAVGVWERAENPDSESLNSWVLGSRSSKGHFKCSDGRWIQNWVPNPRFIMTSSEGDTLNATPDLTVQNDPNRFGMGPEELVVMSHYQPILADRIKRFPAADWVKAAAIANVTVQDVRSVEESLADPLLLADGCVAEVEDPDLGKIRQVGITYKLQTSPGHVPGPAPKPGQHTEAVRSEAARLAKQDPPKSKGGKSLKAPLEGVRVLDFGLAIAGPFGTQLLSDLGADVIKINSLYDMYWHRSHIALTANRGKRSISLNLKDPRAMEVIRKLVESADVVQHNMRYGAATRLGIDYDSLKQINPKLVYCHTRGFEKGVRAPLPGNDQTGACLSGVQHEDGGMSNGGKPIWALTSFGDTGNGFLSAVAILQALLHRARTGEGQFVDTSIINACLLNSSYAVATPEGGGFERPRLDGMQTGMSAGYRLYETAKGWLCVAVMEEAHWNSLFGIADFADLASDARFADANARKANDKALAETLEARFRTKPAEAWFALLDGASVPVEISSDTFSLGLHDDPEFVSRQWVTKSVMPGVGKLEQIGLLYSLSETPTRIQSPPLVVGQDTEELLAELGYSQSDIAQMLTDRVAHSAPPEERPVKAAAK
jgi:crotonobetainyl-CoA:carnitine CoA-transferase CaiB-like acyl-CoA transferase